ncbi:UDP-N-acetylmuramoylalanine--D-glutamate ligase [Candidatus Xiphinematobacter sp. Idaho Grape]|uniref:UDP-N-acetylmuramoyl-L-alanine--D-glutamate ligase n=1 Tax=Candidatus Xiphinematobacter sp. Idaho Grape TaxID=1704307 RepID=UPI0007059826|nr:UDP-N-acetylmuramoyl-L-alanine--D-glutamate ligase [Candidatus Xiphinematobacter sp. Idaho Grape]ALJ56532.1 UDP-N-acetylmuramoylalanine--D-glutamate ligase [Candidatus Xiphinematobacter sp. Idaho Grape]
MRKKAAILGIGCSGEAAARLLHTHGWLVTSLDSSACTSIRTRIQTLPKKGMAFIIGAEADVDPASYDLCVLSPGIKLASPIAQNILRKQIPIISEIELAFRKCQVPVIAVTGTNGKSTTAKLIETLLNRCGTHSRACGNIGPPFSEIVAQPRSDLHAVIVEVSSFQLETIHSFHPHIAVWLNLSRNHLDRYHSMEEYRQAKLRIFLNQTSEDFAVVNARDRLPNLAAKSITFSAEDLTADFIKRESQILFRGTPILDQGHTPLRGSHNTENLMAALATGYCLGLSFGDMARAACLYSPLEHRCEFVCRLNGTCWINDSKSTNLAALERAIQSQTAPLVLIAGGKDKGFEFDFLAPLVRERVKIAILIGEMRHRIAISWQATPSKISETLEDAVCLAARLSAPGDIVLFSPGTSSTDMFSSYEERGRHFKKLVYALPGQPIRCHV